MEPQSLPEQLEAGTTIGDYTVVGKLGFGGMATIYSATHPLIGKRVAIKVINRGLSSNREAVNRFLQEARIVTQIGHPNIVDVFNYGSLPDGRCYFVMEWLNGHTLGALIDGATLNLSDVLEIVLQICDALDAAHMCGVIHRDLKPDNVFVVAALDGRKVVKLLDFGIAKLAGADTPMRLTRSGIAMGTPEYISPEQARGKGVSHHTDIYALGALMYEMILGRVPFRADNAADVMSQHLNDLPPRPRTLWEGIPEVLDELMFRMLAKDPAERPPLADVRTAVVQTWSGLVAGDTPRQLAPRTPPRNEDLVPAHRNSTISLAGEVIAPPAAAPPTRLAQSRRGRVGIVVAGVMIVAGAMFFWPRHQDSSPRVDPRPAATPVALEAVPVPAAVPVPEPVVAPVVTGLPPAVLTVQVDVPTAIVRVDGTPITLGDDGARLEFAEAGDHDVVVSAHGYKTFATRLHVGADKAVHVPVSLVRVGQRARPAADEPAAAEPPAAVPVNGRDDFHTLDPWADKPR